MIKAIQTQYKGYRFRSRLEARWAVFFDALNQRWEYEVEGYVLTGRPFTSEDEERLREAHGQHLSTEDLRILIETERILVPSTFYYLPDFWMPELNAFAEVKGEFSMEDAHKVNRLVNATKKPLLLLRKIGDQQLLITFGDEKVNSCFMTEVGPDPDRKDVWDAAIIAARSARFEHGESPRVPRGKPRT